MTPPEPRLSVVVVVYDMPEVALRTLHSLSPAYQRRLDGAEYEVIVVENGSRRPLDDKKVRAFGDGFRYLAVDDASPSPAAALNRGVDLARGDVVGLMIDGARLATPGLLSEALRAFDLYGEQTVVTTLGFLLKAPADVEPASRAASDRALLDGIDWPRDGDRLFEVGVLGGSSRGGWGETPAESNAIFLSTPRYRALGGYDEAFQLPGGGLVNLDFFRRAVMAPDVEPVLLRGDATFHQHHGGASTGAQDPDATWRRFADDYEALRGEPWTRAPRAMTLFGRERGAPVGEPHGVPGRVQNR